MTKEMTFAEYLESKQRLYEMAQRLGLEKIEDDGTAYSVICQKLIERIEQLEDLAEFNSQRANDAYVALRERIERLEKTQGKALPHWTDMPR